MEYLHYINDFVLLIIKDLKSIYFPTWLALTALYLPIFLLSIFNHSILKISKWISTSLIVIYLLIIPTWSPVRSIPVFNTCIAAAGFYYAEKVCEWLLIRSDEFRQWSFFDIHHELFYYRVYTQPVSMRKIDQKKKAIFFTGPIQFDQRVYSLVCITCNIIKYCLLLDLVIYFLYEVFNTNLYEKYYTKYLLIQILVNQLSGAVVYLVYMICYETLRHVLCTVFNRPIELIPDLFRQPYRAVSSSDFWSRWHQVFKNTWIELIYKPVSLFLRNHWPHLPKSVIDGTSLICVFLFSGIMHEYNVYISLNIFSGSQIKFFLIQGLAVLTEHSFKRLYPQVHIPKPIGILFTFIFNGITAGYFIEPWIFYIQRRHTLKYSLIDFLIRNLSNKY